MRLAKLFSGAGRLLRRCIGRLGSWRHHTMADPVNKSDGGPVNISAKMDVRFLRAGEHTLLVPVPDDIALLLARVIISWGAFELRMDAVIGAFLTSLRKPEPPRWRFLSFDQRKRLFKDLAIEYTTAVAPHETDTFRKIADVSGDLQWRRNTVAHGYIKGRSLKNPASPTGFDAIFYAVNHYKGREVQIDLDEATLTKLWHDIAHLGGNLMAGISRLGGRLETISPELVIADKDVLQNGPTGSLPTLETWQPPQSPPRSSPA